MISITVVIGRNPTCGKRSTMSARISATPANSRDCLRPTGTNSCAVFTVSPQMTDDQVARIPMAALATTRPRCMPKHTHKEFIKFLNAVERAVPAGKVIHAIADNYATHKHPNVIKWLADHPRWTFHFTPTSASWLNAVEGFFSTITRRKIRRGVFKSVAELQDAIERYIKAHNKTSKPFVWTASASAIFEKLPKIPVPSE